MSKIWLDITTVMLWNRPAVGVVRMEAECAKYFLSAKEKNIHFCYYSDADKIYREIDRQSLGVYLRSIQNNTEYGKINSSTTNLQQSLGLSQTKEEKIKNKIIRFINFFPEKFAQLILCHARERKELFNAAMKAFRLTKQTFREFRKVCRLFLFPKKKAKHNFSHQEKIINVSPPLFNVGDIYISMGLDWDQKNMPYLYSLKRKTCFKILLFCYDTIPVKLPHTCLESTATRFSRYFADMAWCADEIFCISECTRKDLQSLLHELGAPLPKMSVIHLGCNLPELGQEKSISANIQKYVSMKYILFVSTIERRKNHEVLYRAYTRLIDQGEKELPLLIFVGMSGWAVNDFLVDLNNDPRTQKYIKILNNVEDSDLEFLYRNAYFTVYPSLYEGWGLPVAESLAYGKFCLASNAASIPEVGGDLIEYIDPWDLPKWTERLKWYFDHPDAVDNLSARIRRSYIPCEWNETAEHVLSKAKKMSINNSL